MASSTHVALDGGVVDIAGSVDLANPPTSMVVASVRGREHEFTAGRRSWAESVAHEFGVALNEEYLLQGGRLRLGSALQVDAVDSRENILSLAVWQGQAFSVETAVYEGNLAYLIALFDMFTVEERDLGLVITPKDSASTALIRRGGKQPTLAKWVPGLGLLEIWQRTQAADVPLPVWQGAPVQGGELFKEISLEGQTILLLVGVDAVTRVYSDRDSSLDTVLGGLASLVVRWSPVD